MTRAFVFDFDGVLFDTIEECLIMAYTTVRRLAGKPEKAPPKEIAEPFLAHRYLVGPPWQYAVLLECIARGQVPGAAEFAVLAKSRAAALADFTDAYFAARAKLSADASQWLRAIRPYEVALNRYRELHEQGAIILSTRDPASIEKIFTHYAGFAPRQLPRAGPREKWETLQAFAESKAIAPSEVFFLDDHLPHVTPAKQRGFTTALATWGYLGPTDLQEAGRAGVRCVSLGELGSAIIQHQEAS